MNKSDRHIKVKVTLGYLFCLVALLLSLFFIQRDYEHLITADNYEHEVVMRRRAINKTLSLLYQSEASWQSFLLGKVDDNTHYQSLMADLIKSLRVLRSYSVSQSQLDRIDSVSGLLVVKQDNTDKLSEAIRESQTGDVNYSRILRQHYKVVPQKHVYNKVIVQRDSVVDNSHKKGFFKRLAEVFVPSKDDKKVIKESRVFKSDTILRPYDPTKTVPSIVHEIETTVKNKRSWDNGKVNALLFSLKAENNVITDRVNQILEDFEREDEKRNMMIIASQTSTKKSSIRTLIVITTFSLVLFFVLLIIILRDLSRNNRYRRELEEARLRAERLMLTREKLMLTITHDFKAPLGSILGYTDLLLRITNDERSSEYLKNMKSSSDHLLQLVNDLLDFHRLDANKMEVNNISFNPFELFHEIELSFLPQAERKGLKLSVAIDSTLDRIFSGDPLRIRQIVNNLVSNALKFTSKGGVTIMAQYLENRLRIKVMDTGCGLPEQDQNKIFEEFTRLSNAQGEEGFGLGLSITKKMVSLLSGSISVQSEKGSGSSFIVLIPVSLEENKKQTEEKTNDKSLNILLIDDDRIQMDMTVEMLKSKGIFAVGHLEYNEILDELQHHSFDLLLTDLQMPTINGIDLLHKLRKSAVEQAKFIPVIAVTARSEVSDSELRAMGFSGCLHKPFTVNELLKIVSQNSLGIDVSGLTSLSGDDDAISTKIWETFIEETSKNRESFQSALDHKDVSLLGFLSHKMLPVFTMIQAQSCLNEMKWLEVQKSRPFDEQTEQKARQVLEVINRSIIEVQRKIS